MQTTRSVAEKLYRTVGSRKQKLTVRPKARMAEACSTSWTPLSDTRIRFAVVNAAERLNVRRMTATIASTAGSVCASRIEFMNLIFPELA
jgi:hypothetical protein